MAPGHVGQGYLSARLPADGFLPVAALDAYDAMVNVPRTTLTADISE